MADADDRPLERLLFHLESAGLTEQAHDAIDLSLPSAQRAGFRLQRYGASGRPPTRPGRRELVAATRARAFVELRKAEATPRWRSIGPDAIANVNGSHVSGHVSAIAVDPSDRDHLLVAGSAGGTWESQDGGARWVPRGDREATTSIGALAFDPADSNVVYCATGDAQGVGYLGAGLLRSTDGGRTWQTRCAAPFVGIGFFDLKVRSQHLFAGTSEGLYVSDDAGVTWHRRREQVTWSLAVVSGQGQGQLMAACEDGLFESNDGGDTWDEVALPAAPAIWRMAVAISPSDQSIAYAWAAYDEGFEGSSGDWVNADHRLYKRDGGQWTRQSEFVAMKLRASHNWALAVSPTQPNRIYCGAIQLWRGDIGQTTSWMPLSYVNEEYRIHPDFHAVAFDPTDADIVYAGCDGGLFRSKNAGGTWEHLNRGLVISDFRGLAQGSSPVIAGLQDNGSIRRVGRTEWEHVMGGDGGDCAIKPAEPKVMVATNFDMTPAWSHNGGTPGSFERRLPPVPDGEKSAFYPPLEYTADNGSTFAIAGGALYVTRDDGSAWFRCDYPGDAAAKGSALYIPDEDNIYVGLADGRVIRTHWSSGSAWSSFFILATPRADAGISDLHVHGQSIWATSRKDGGGRVFHSTNGGDSWIDRSKGLPDISVNSVAVNLTNSRVWVGTDCGVWESADAGATWTPFSSGLPNVMVSQLAFHAPSGRLRAGTRSRGAWEVDVNGWSPWSPWGPGLEPEDVAPAVASLGPDLLDVFARGENGHLWQKSWRADHWGPWQELGAGRLTSHPAAVADRSPAGGLVPRLHVYARGFQNQLAQRDWTVAGWGDQWQNLGGRLTSAPAVAMIGSLRYVFVRGHDQQLAYKRWNGEEWSEWRSLGGTLTSAPAAVSWGPGRIDVFARGPANQLLHIRWNGEEWSGWRDLGGRLTSGPAVASWGPGRLDVFVRGHEGGLAQKRWNGDEWSEWRDLGGRLTSGPGAVSWGPNRIDVFVRGHDHQLAHKRWNGTEWSEWRDLDWNG